MIIVVIQRERENDYGTLIRYFTRSIDRHVLYKWAQWQYVDGQSTQTKGELKETEFDEQKYTVERSFNIHFDCPVSQ